MKEKQILINNIKYYSKRDAHKSPSSILELHAGVIEQWNQIPPDFCSRLFESMSKHIRAII